MIEGYARRGEVYWTGKLGSSTLKLVVSSGEDNRASEYVGVAAMCLVKPHRGVTVNVTGQESWVCCSNIQCVPRKYLRELVGRLTPEEMAQVDDQLERFFDLGYENTEELDELRAENARLKREVEYGKEGILARSSEITRYKKLYDKAVDQIAEMTLAADVAKRIAEKTAAVVEDPESEEQVEETVEETGPVVVETVEEEPPVVVAKEPDPAPKPPKVTKKVNVNTANIYELMEVGFGKSEAAKIVRWGRKYGAFKTLDDLTKVDGVTGKTLRKIRDKLEV